ncbi:glutathione S-transferase D7-like isoform X3 [Pectinophora gossypiella]|uniref:glutathione S-transferase D7-like isoform X3 n=1 Tax=Pectinophora gossypiella TaxID=13191 RepID=UPI00214E4916|nr:glutathione S-transferase D7-like isoform X3 [Pectinophora gossypiella]
MTDRIMLEEEIKLFWEYVKRNAAARSKSSRMPTLPIKLYYLPPSPPCRVVMMAARVMGIELDLILTNIMEGAHMTPEYLKMNPQHTIPTMDDNGFILWESRAIIAYLANAYGKDDSLYPKNPRLRAIVDQRLNFDIGTLFQRYMQVYAPMLFHGEEFDEEKAEKLNEALGWFNNMLDGKAFVAGDNMTIADISIIVIITNLDAFGFDMSAHENVMKWFERMKKELEPYGYMEIDHAGAQILASFLKKD